MLNDTPAGLSSAEEDTGDMSVPAAITDIGCEREINEDRYAVIDSSAGRAWIVCDGMGGCLGGELAAQLAIDAVRRALESQHFENGEDALRFAIEEANRVIVLRRQNPAFSSMGTTIVGVLIDGDEVSITHAGDSRAYLVREGNIQQLTVDHTYVQDLVERGAITAQEALSHPQSHVLTRCLGAEPRLELESQVLWVWDIDAQEKEDLLVVCSDGLYSLISDEEIAEVVSTTSPQQACVNLVELAKNRGGFDNITLAVLPLGGQLRDEESINPRRKEKKRVRATQNAPSRARRRKKIPLGRKIALMVTLMVLGILLSALFFMFRVAG